MAAPKYKIGAYVYLVESANAGNLESLQITGLRQVSDGRWVYTFSIPQRPPTHVATMGDRNTGKQSYDIELNEADLTDFVTAVDLAESFFTAQMSKLAALRNQFVGSE